jgi:hypothetical protein
MTEAQLRSEIAKRDASIHGLRQILEAYKEQLNALNAQSDRGDQVSELTVQLQTVENEKSCLENMTTLQKEEIAALHGLIETIKGDLKTSRGESASNLQTVRALTEQVEMMKKKNSKGKDKVKSLEKKIERLEKRGKETEETFALQVLQRERESESDLSALRDQNADLSMVVSGMKQTIRAQQSMQEGAEQMLMHYEDVFGQNFEFASLKEELQSIQAKEKDAYLLEMERKVRELDTLLEREQAARIKLENEREILLEQVKEGVNHAPSLKSYQFNPKDVRMKDNEKHPPSPTRKGLMEEPLLAGYAPAPAYGGVNSNSGTPRSLSRRNSDTGSIATADDEEGDKCCCVVQ